MHLHHESPDRLFIGLDDGKYREDFSVPIRPVHLCSLTHSDRRAQFVFVPKLIQWGMQADARAIFDAFGKNEQVMRVC